MTPVPQAKSQGEEEWSPFLLNLPPWRALCKWRYELSGAEWIAEGWPDCSSDLWPYLWWKLTGIERMKGGA